MKPDDLDRVLLRDVEIVPSSGFARSVMAAVRNEAAAPPPIPFPWKRALPGLVACVVAMVWAFMEGLQSPVPESVSTWSDSVLRLLGEAHAIGAGWALLGLLMTVAGLKLTWQLKGRG